MANRVRLEYGDYRPMRQGDPGYTNASQRRMYSPSRRESISRREFAAKATRIPLPQKPRVSHGKSLEKHPRKSRIDKGVSKADRATIMPMLKEAQRRKGIIPDRQRGLDRMEVAKAQYEKKTGIPVESNASDFYERYDKIRHPYQYDGSDIASTYDFFFYDEDNEDYVDDFPLGETP